MGLVYRSVDDIGGLVHVHAPTVDLFHIGVGWVYGLDEDCSLKVVGMGIGLGDKVFDINFDHLLDEDGLQCETRQVIALNAPKPAPQPTAKPITAPIKTPSRPTDVRKYELLTDTTRTWSDAQAACQETFGTDLASVHSVAEQDVAYELCIQSGADCWIGLHRDSEDVSGWKWSDGSTVDYGSDYSGGVYPWQGGEPNNWNGVGEECAEIYYVHSSWNDVPCGQKQYALCNAVGRVVSRTYTKYSNKQCEGTNTDILRDFDGTVAACEAKCDELNCIGFIRVQSTGRCYFRGGEMNRPYDYTSDERDCYIPGAYWRGE